MKAPFSPYLTAIAPGLQELIRLLSGRYEYVSVLSTDSVGFHVTISQRSKSVSNETMTTERGTVVRVYKNGLYSEASFNRFDPAHPEQTAKEIGEELDRQFSLLEEAKVPVYETGVLDDEPETLLVEMETGRLPEDEDIGRLIENLSAVSDEGMKRGEHLLDCSASAQSTHISKLFLTKCRDLRQSYVYSEGSVVCTGSRDGRTEMGREGVSGRVGPELFDDLSHVLDEAFKDVNELLSAERVTPGEYDIITAPDVTGLIAHEAFGHGVEMDMFVKNRALGKEYIGKRVGSELCTMHEGALCAESVTAYAFDDEGTPAGDVTEIERENFAHKAYTRMTNTVFDSGESTLEEMVASVKHGYLLQGTDSGMEDPKHWGIQCIMSRGYEIRDGAFTGRVVSPVVMTGYVPDLLGNISMASVDRRVDGNGACGKGHKEWVKVADGGPYLKTKARLG